MDPAERELTIATMRGFRMAAADMQITREAAEAIMSGEYVEFSRILETALVVTYSRPFTVSYAHARLEEPRWAPDEESDPLDLHGTLLALRDGVYAHNDDQRARTVRYLSGGMHAEQWWSLDPAILPSVVAMTNGQQARFATEAKRLERQIRDHEDVEPTFRPTSELFAQLQRQIDQREGRQ